MLVQPVAYPDLHLIIPFYTEAQDIALRTHGAGKIVELFKVLPGILCQIILPVDIVRDPLFSHGGENEKKFQPQTGLGTFHSKKWNRPLFPLECWSTVEDPGIAGE